MGKSTVAPRHLAVVVWNDAHGNAHREVTEEELPHRPIVMTTVGWLLRQDETGVSIANEQALDVDSSCYRGHTFIPAGMIQSVTVVKESKPRSKRPTSQQASQNTSPPET